MRALMLLVAVAVASMTVPAHAADEPSAQSSGRSSAVFLEFGGTTGLLGLNYEWRPAALKSRYGFRVGGSAFPALYVLGGHPFVVATGSAQYLMFDGPHRLELGVAATLAISRAGPLPFFFPLVGYRFEGDSGLFMRCTLTPVVGLGPPFRLWGGLSLGYIW